MMSRRALITGISGQDGSYLAELLVEKGYEVHGVVRRISQPNLSNLAAVIDRIELHTGDMTDGASLNRIIDKTRPHEIYNLAGMSQVRDSYDHPEVTQDINAGGLLRIMEACRTLGLNPKIYQACSSEMFGRVRETPQTENTPFNPRSPYGSSKVSAYNHAKVWREAYGMRMYCGILFNHECVAENTPLIVRENGVLKVVTPDELIARRRKGPNVQTFDISDIDVWDGKNWTPIRAITASLRRPADPNHRITSIQTRAGVIEATAHHRMLDAGFADIPAGNVVQGDRLAIAGKFPAIPPLTALTPEMAEFLGLMCAEGFVDERGHPQFTNNDEWLRDRVATLWRLLFLGTSRTWFAPSGFSDRTVGQLALTGCNVAGRWLREQIYAPNGAKRVPAIILNANLSIQKSFLDAHYCGDGLKAGKGDSVKTNSSVLAQGLCWLYAAQGRDCSVYVEHRKDRRYYMLNLFSANVVGAKGQHLRKDPAEVRRIDEPEAPSDWVYDLETESEHFCAGVGRLIVHNSPRRGEAFLSRKVCKAVAEISAGRRDKLKLGNLDAKRDWGYAKEYVAWIHAIMQHDQPDDFVIATGETHSVREFVERAFARVGIADWEQFVEYDRTLTRPAEVDLLHGDASKSKRVLGFEPKVKFEELVNIMVDAEVAKLSSPSHSDERRDLYSFPEAKLIVAKKDTVIGKHYHKKKTEKFILSKGRCHVRIVDVDEPEFPLSYAMQIGRIVTIEPGQYHEFHIGSGSVLIGLNSHPYDPTDDYKPILDEVVASRGLMAMPT